MPFKYRAEARSLADKVEDLMQRVTDEFMERAGYSKEQYTPTFSSRTRGTGTGTFRKEYYWLLSDNNGLVKDSLYVLCTYREQEDMIHLIDAANALKAL